VEELQSKLTSLKEEKDTLLKKKSAHFQQLKLVMIEDKKRQNQQKQKSETAYVVRLLPSIEYHIFIF